MWRVANEFVPVLYNLRARKLVINTLCPVYRVEEETGRIPKFRRLHFKYVPREANKAAHELALEGQRYEDPRYWMEEVPRAVEKLVNRDRSSGDDGG
ncbi:hypothetical protein GOBAR_DD16678 [Gossypium barbadense]|nr:hypothetical protein GOBAR_DD16678 [Gossypium barbadense]